MATTKKAAVYDGKGQVIFWTPVPACAKISYRQENGVPVGSPTVVLLRENVAKGLGSRLTPACLRAFLEDLSRRIRIRRHVQTAKGEAIDGVQPKPEQHVAHL